MQRPSPTLRLSALHLLAWIGFVIYELSLVFLIGAPFNFLETLLSFLLNAGLFYVNCLWLMPRFYARRHYLLYLLALLGLLSSYALMRYALNIYIFPTLLHQPMVPISSYKLFWGQTLYRGIYFLLPSIGYWYARNALQLEKQKRQQEHELRVAEKNLMEANLAFLKNQINPHFLFNSLNFLYAQVYPHSEETAKGILLLSDIMRYALKEEDNGKVMLEKEVEHLQNYIAINQLRFSNKLQVNFEIIGSLQFMMIIPLVLITFVENCFKHGELADPANPLTIQIKTINNQLVFYTHNKKRDGPKEKSTGIGLVNTKRRLDMVYKERYMLTVNDAQDDYTCTLTIAL
jgi:two-component system LytT family sensor kinase